MEKINTEKFLKFLERGIVEEYAMEASEVSKGNYGLALECKGSRLAYEFIKRAIEGDPDDDKADFMEEADE